MKDQGGDQVTEFDNGNWAHSNIWAGGKLTATYDTKGIHYELADPLGTKRVQANALGQVDETCTSLPFGNDVGNPIGANCALVANSLSTADDATEHHFTQKERDTESGNDYFFARYYSSALGRFTTPDWSAKEDPVPYALFGDPQSLNLYTYARNTPTVHMDADGHDFIQDANQNWIKEHQITDFSGKFGAELLQAATGAPQGGQTAADARVDPRAAGAANAAHGILSRNNPCSNFFNSATDGSAAAVFSSESIIVSEIDPSTGQKTYSADPGAMSVQGDGANSRIYINPNGPFFKSTGIVNNEMRSLKVGRYTGGTLKAQVEILFHELGHLTNAKGIVRDAGDSKKSTQNTEQIIKQCGSEIDKLP